MEQREVHRRVAYVGGGPPHACAVMPWGGGNSYFMLGVGGCNYDASTVSRTQRRWLSYTERVFFLTSKLLHLTPQNDDSGLMGKMLFC